MSILKLHQGFFFALLIANTMLTGCIDKVISTKGPGPVSGDYKEDLSSSRPKYKVEGNTTTTNTTKAENKAQSQNINIPTTSGDITKKLDVILDTIAIRNKNIRFAQGFRIQVYSGGSREEANRARERSYALFPDITPHILYVQPTFRVKVGDFMDRLEAQRVYAGLVPDFPNALIVPDRIEIR